MKNFDIKIVRKKEKKAEIKITARIIIKLFKVKFSSNLLTATAVPVLVFWIE